LAIERDYPAQKSHNPIVHDHSKSFLLLAPYLCHPSPILLYWAQFIDGGMKSKERNAETRSQSRYDTGHIKCNVNMIKIFFKMKTLSSNQEQTGEIALLVDRRSFRSFQTVLEHLPLICKRKTILNQSNANDHDLVSNNVPLRDETTLHRKIRTTMTVRKNFTTVNISILKRERDRTVLTE
jgi:hypothetical protein